MSTLIKVCGVSTTCFCGGEEFTGDDVLGGVSQGVPRWNVVLTAGYQLVESGIVDVDGGTSVGAEALPSSMARTKALVARVASASELALSLRCD